MCNISNRGYQSHCEHEESGGSDEWQLIAVITTIMNQDFKPEKKGSRKEKNLNNQLTINCTPNRSLSCVRVVQPLFKGGSRSTARAQMTCATKNARNTML